MNTVPSKTENPDGLHRRYKVEHEDGTPLDPGFEFFVLRLDESGEPHHVRASRIAIQTYATAIEPYIPKLAQDLRARYTAPQAIDIYQDTIAPESKSKFSWEYLGLALCGEAAELSEAIRSQRKSGGNLLAVEDEVGDLIYYLAVAAHKLTKHLSQLPLVPVAKFELMAELQLCEATGLLANGVKKCTWSGRPLSAEWLIPRLGVILALTELVASEHSLLLPTVLASHLEKVKKRGNFPSLHEAVPFG